MGFSMGQFSVFMEAGEVASIKVLFYGWQFCCAHIWNMNVVALHAIVCTTKFSRFLGPRFNHWLQPYTTYHKVDTMDLKTSIFYTATPICRQKQIFLKLLFIELNYLSPYTWFIIPFYFSPLLVCYMYLLVLF